MYTDRETDIADFFVNAPRISYELTGRAWGGTIIPCCRVVYRTCTMLLRPWFAAPGFTCLGADKDSVNVNDTCASNIIA